MYHVQIHVTISTRSRHCQSHKLMIMMKIMSQMRVLTKKTTDKTLDHDPDQLEKYLAAVLQSGRSQSHEIATAAGKSEVCRKSMPTLTTNCPDQDNDRDDVGDDDDNDDDSGDVCTMYNLAED